jgi:integrase
MGTTLLQRDRTYLLRRHPKRATVCSLESEEYFIALTFERFWQATALTQQVSFMMVAAALQYLRASLHGAILDTLRVYQRTKEPSLPQPAAEDQTASLEVWEMLQTLLLNQRERRLAYLLYHCGLKPGEIVQLCPQEWSDAQEISRLRRNVLDRFMRNADRLRGRFSHEGRS